MNPIISPWVIYLISIADGVKNFFTGVTIISGVVFIVFLFFYLSSNLFEDEDVLEDFRKAWKLIKKLIAVFIVSLFLAIFIPSKNTLIVMYVANNITANRVEKVLEGGREAKEELKKDIIEIIQTITKKEKKD